MNEVSTALFAPSVSPTMQAGETILLIDPKDRAKLVRLESGKVLHTHLGVLMIDDVIGKDSGSRVKATAGEFVALRPTLTEFLQKIPRQSQIIYPKDLGTILVLGDIFPGATVLEAGIGSGALTLALLRAVGPYGKVISYEIREDMAHQALKNIRLFLGDVPPTHGLRMQNVYDGIVDGDIDRVVLDVPEPWQAVPPVADALRPGGVFVIYVPTAMQVYKAMEALEAHPAFTSVETTEILWRPWEQSGLSLRPAHRMVAHTGFIIVARRLAD